MIPVRLTVRDFLSYADPEPIDFTGFDVACLSGHNGAGKSALLDAITYALFGAARGCEGGQNQDRLVRDGTNEAVVDFEFILNDSTYRVVRTRIKDKKTDLRFLIADEDGWTNIAGESLRETQAAISSELRMDYRTFTASAFFVQGRADDFLARMDPEERKDVFARLLDLGAYQRLEDAARAKARDAETNRRLSAHRVEELSGAITKAQAAEAELADTERRAKAAQSEIDEHTSRVEGIRTNVGELEKDETRLQAERDSIATLQRGITQQRRDVAEREKEIAELAALLARADEISEAQKEADHLRAEELRAREQQVRSLELGSALLAARERLEAERMAIEARRSEREKQITRVARDVRDLAKTEKELTQLVAALDGSKDPRPAIEESRALLDGQRAADARLGEELRSIESNLADLHERAAILKRGKGECPICGSPLDAPHRRQVATSIREQAGGFQHRRDAAKAERETARKEASRCMEELKRLEASATERDRLLARADAVTAALTRAPELRQSLAALQASAAQDAGTLAEASFGADIRREIARLEADLASAYDAVTHDRVRARLTVLEPYGALAGRLEEATARRVAIQIELEDFRERLKASETQLRERIETAESLQNAVAGLPGARRTLVKAERDLDARRTAAAEASSQVARLAERLETLRRDVTERKKAAEEERASATEHRRYSRLAQAFGRGGIPDLIIDNARPDLEHDANTILGRLTDYEMSLRFLMQKTTRAKTVRETFDVLVRHDGGDRDFAMFSGGEAFRIAFAVRLALSKLLVRRAGARLETLVIDEGFGTQDPAGRERVVAAVREAQQEFRKVLVITHFDDLKDHFGAQIRVSKDSARGSIVQVVPG